MNYNKVKLLDCTLRDGGYYNNWFFEKELINEYLKVMDMIKDNSKIELIWASPRELFNLIQANEIGCHIITATNDILNKLKLIGKNLEEFSIETVEMFYNDAKSSGFNL